MVVLQGTSGSHTQSNSMMDMSTGALVNPSRQGHNFCEYLPYIVYKREHAPTLIRARN